MEYCIETPNYEGVFNAFARQNIESIYVDALNALSNHYYRNKDLDEKQSFIYQNVNYGILTKTQFDYLQAIINYKMQLAVLNCPYCVYRPRLNDNDELISQFDRIAFYENLILNTQNLGYDFIIISEIQIQSLTHNILI